MVFLNRDDAYEDAIRKFPQYKDVAGKDAFPASFVVKLVDPEQHEEFDKAMVGQPGVQGCRTRRTWSTGCSRCSTG